MRNNVIAIKNELPELLAAVCEHPDCFDALKDAIWDAFSGEMQASVYTVDYWRASMQAIMAHDRYKSRVVAEEEGHQEAIH